VDRPDEGVNIPDASTALAEEGTNDAYSMAADYAMKLLRGSYLKSQQLHSDIALQDVNQLTLEEPLDASRMLSPSRGGGAPPPVLDPSRIPLKTQTESLPP